MIFRLSWKYLSQGGVWVLTGLVYWASASGAPSNTPPQKESDPVGCPTQTQATSTTNHSSLQNQIKPPCTGTKNPTTKEQVRESDYGALAGNPAAVNLFNGTGKLGELLGISPETGIKFGGLWIGNTAFIMGGQNQGDATYNNLLIVDLQADLEKFAHIPGASFAATFLQFDGGRTNVREGVAVGFDGLTEAGPLNRSELYQLWWRQKLFDDKVIFRLGKSIPYVDFGNVIKALPIDRERSPPIIPAVTALVYAPVFVNPTMLGVMPGYYNSAWGITGSLIPNEYYASVGFFDGSLARGVQTGTLAGPTFNSYYFTIGEAGKVWGGQYPGKIAFGGWGQSGQLCNGLSTSTTCNPQQPSQNGMQGFYSLLTNRLLSVDWADKPGAIVGFLQYGINNAHYMMANQFVGGGLSAFGIIPNRNQDSLGLGFGLSYLNGLSSSTTLNGQAIAYPSFSRTQELITQFYYQAHLWGDIYIEPVLSYVPHPAINMAPSIATQNPSGSSAYPASTSAIVQLIALF